MTTLGQFLWISDHLKRQRFKMLFGSANYSDLMRHPHRRLRELRIKQRPIALQLLPFLEEAHPA
ncbi:MAG: hypothetical protein LUQ38_12400 [Methanotrichaceae archaeon]|nr:hypothetical protein [Methanotrichaceae archaeon]